ncbi:hypothetical protein QJS66_18910 [Kocuria rhizophila]|nr:hypothetical protein QJS66_18910 [Kocuria rhizophila]
MHHAAADKASGFCVSDDYAVAIQRLLDDGVQRVLYLDVDGPRGSGLAVRSLRTSPRHDHLPCADRALPVPGLGLRQRDQRARAGPPERWSSVAMPARSDDAQWLRAFDAVVPDHAGVRSPR